MFILVKLFVCSPRKWGYLIYMSYMYHHCMDLTDITFGEIHPTAVHTYRKLVRDGLDLSNVVSSFYVNELFANWWLEKQIGFYPLFLSVGSTREDINMTGYPYQWSRIVSSSYDQEKKKMVNKLVRPGEFRNAVLFSFRKLEEVVYTDYGDWFEVLNYDWDVYPFPDRIRRYVLKPSWSESAWLRKAKKEPHHVMGVIPKLDLRLADRILVRNKKTARFLTELGFKNVRVKRLPKPQL